MTSSVSGEAGKKISPLYPMRKLIEVERRYDSFNNKRGNNRRR